jgi:hypothetical protein
MKNIHHIVAIEAGLRAGKRVHFFPGWYAVWNEEYQQGWIHMPFKVACRDYDHTFYGWETFIEAVKDAICNDEYRIDT